MTEYIYDTSIEATFLHEQKHEEIVRCRDCKHYHATYNSCDEFGDIWHDEYATVEPDGFCAWALRKEVDE